MRSTRATAAVARLNERCPEAHYSVGLTGGALFILSLDADGGRQRIGNPLPLDEFVQFVNAQGPQAVRRVTKNDAAFEKQLVKKPAL